MHNTGQNSGAADADVDAPEGWDTRTSALTTLAHGRSGPANSADGPNGLDDDNNGVIDDVFGIVAWQARIVACKFLDTDGSGANSDASEALWYAWEQAGADVISGSFGGGTESAEVANQIMAAGKNGAIVVAAGNDNVDLEDTPTYPAASQLENIVTVASTTRTEARSSFSNYNYGWVNVGAPGSDITSLGNASDTDYRVLSGTSMATPLTAGIVGLLRARYPSETYGRIINRLYRGVDPASALDLKVQTGGRVKLQKALATTSGAPFNDGFVAASVMPGSATRSERTGNFSATAESGEPAHGGVSANKTVWYKWTVPATSGYILSTQGSASSTFVAGTGGAADTYGSATLDTTLGVYTGSALNALSLAAIYANANQ